MYRYILYLSPMNAIRALEAARDTSSLFAWIFGSFQDKTACGDCALVSIHLQRQRCTGLFPNSTVVLQRGIFGDANVVRPLRQKLGRFTGKLQRGLGWTIWWL